MKDSPCLAGVTNPFIARGARLAASTPIRRLTGAGKVELQCQIAAVTKRCSSCAAARRPLLAASCWQTFSRIRPCPTQHTLPSPQCLAGVSPLDGLLHHLLTPAFLLPQALNLCGSVLFAAVLGSGDISLAVPVANGAGPLCVHAKSSKGASTCSVADAANAAQPCSTCTY